MINLYESLKNFKPIFTVEPPRTTGFYAFYANSDCFEDTELHEIKKFDCIYIGIAKDETLWQRVLESHLKDSGKSTFRRSLGAILRIKLGLNPIMRGITVTKSNISNFKFCSDSEIKLSNFMTRKLSVAFYSCDSNESNLEAIEKKLIDEFGFPAFNLEYARTRNKYYHIIKKARKECRNIVAEHLR